MTEQELRAKVVSIAKSYYGCKESDGSHKKIIDLYNTGKPAYCTYKMKYTDPWCATSVSAWFIKAGLIDIAPCECSCSRMIAQYQKIGRWQERDDYVPTSGDIMMYDWDDNGAGDNRGAPEHVGLVVSVTGNQIKVIEGNMNNAVGYRNMTVNGRYIRGYCLPNYAAKATSAVSNPAATTTPTTTPAATGGINFKTKITTAKELADRALYVAKNFKTLYVIGCFGAPMNAANKKRYINNGSHNSYNAQASRKAMINAATADTFGFDCVCLIKGLMWGWCGDASKTYGGAGYACNGVPDISADGIIQKCPGGGSTTGWANMEVGELLWTTGHVGIYVGNGLAVECTPSWQNKVQVTAVKNIGTKSGYNARTWKKHGKLPYVTYTKEAAPSVPSAPPTTSYQISHVVKAGDTLGKIAAKYGTDVQTLASINGITNVNVINVGQVIYLSYPAAAIEKLAKLHVIDSPSIWHQAVSKNTVNYLGDLFVYAAKKITKAGTRCTSVNEALDILVKAGVMNSPDYWRNCANSNKLPNLNYLLMALGGALK